MAEVCANAIPQGQDNADAYLLRGYAAILGCPNIARAMEMWVEAFPNDEIHEELQSDDPEGEREAAARVLSRLGDRNPRLSAFLSDYYDVGSTSSSA